MDRLQSEVVYHSTDPVNGKPGPWCREKLVLSFFEETHYSNYSYYKAPDLETDSLCSRVEFLLSKYILREKSSIASSYIGILGRSTTLYPFLSRVMCEQCTGPNM